MKSVQFIFGVHNHQPVGNFHHIFEKTYRQGYLPFIEALERHPSISMVLHYSGCLIEWLESHHPEFLDRVGKLVERGNIELLSSAFYEPILAVIPDHDKLGQIRKMSQYLKDRFGYDARGLWLAERVWEPHLAKPIRESGIGYIVVDDFHFLATGEHEENLTGYFMTEEQGKTIAIFPISQRLRYAIPFRQPEETLEILDSFSDESGDNVIVMADDGEKFGIWPGTHATCYGKEKWLERFFRLLEGNQDWVRTTTFREYMESHQPKGRVYLPSTSYFEMNEWTLPGDRGAEFSDFLQGLGDSNGMNTLRPFLRGGTWRNFMSLYGESNWMHKRVTGISYRLAASKGDDDDGLRKAQDDLWRSQCNCAYWHGIFGGLYLPHLRHAIYEHMLAAESWLNERGQESDLAHDLDSDGAVEYQSESDKLRIITSERGGIIEEFDYLPKNFNLLNTLRRYQESYHAKVAMGVPQGSDGGSIHNIITAKEPGLEKLLQYDPWPRKMLLDHFVPLGTNAEQMKRNVPEHGEFIGTRYEAFSDGQFGFRKVGRAFGKKLLLEKRLSLYDSKLAVEITIANRTDGNVSGLYGCEMNFSMLGGHAPDRYYEKDGKVARPRFLDSTADDSAVRSLGIVNERDGFRVIINFPEGTDLWRFPVETVSMSEAGLERIYQSSVVIPHWELDLHRAGTFSAQFTICVEALS